MNVGSRKGKKANVSNGRWGLYLVDVYWHAIVPEKKSGEKRHKQDFIERESQSMKFYVKHFAVAERRIPLQPIIASIIHITL